MPMKPKRPCRYPGCPKLTDGLYCEEHARLCSSTMRSSRAVTPPARGTAEHGNESVTATFTSILCEMCLKQGRYKTSRGSPPHHSSPREGQMMRATS